MITISEIADLRQQITRWRQSGLTIAFVPTMGNLHAGHLSLIDEARRRADKVVASIFVNPLQFAQGEDFGSYPRTLDRDSGLLSERKTDLLFTPTEAALYPDGKNSISIVSVPELSDILCGAFRPGHFIGVATVVAKLFNIVQPQMAVFGKKDFQQLLVIKRMVSDLNLPIEIIGLDTKREKDGLAMSSRNGYLSAEDRKAAAGLYKVLQQVEEAILSGDLHYKNLQTAAITSLKEQGFVPDYVEIRNPENLNPAMENTKQWIVLAAARIGKTRLIDNVEISIEADI